MSQHGHHFAEELYDPNLPKAVGCMTVPPLIQECHIVLLGFIRRLQRTHHFDTAPYKSPQLKP